MDILPFEYESLLTEMDALRDLVKLLSIENELLKKRVAYLESIVENESWGDMQSKDGSKEGSISPPSK